MNRLLILISLLALTTFAACGNDDNGSDDQLDEVERLQTQLAESEATVDAQPNADDSDGRSGGGPYPDPVRNEFLTACNAERGPGQSEEAFATYCSCTLEELEANFTLDEFEALEQRILDGEEMPDELWDAVQACGHHVE